MGEVGTKKLFEDERIVVWEFALEPRREHGATCTTRTHVVRDRRLHARGLRRGWPYARLVRGRTGEIFSIDRRGGELVSNDGRGRRVAASHSARNAGRTRYREILVEK
jgi:hypothetical protein